MHLQASTGIAETIESSYVFLSDDDPYSPDTLSSRSECLDRDNAALDGLAHDTRWVNKRLPVRKLEAVGRRHIADDIEDEGTVGLAFPLAALEIFARLLPGHGQVNEQPGIPEQAIAIALFGDDDVRGLVWE